MNEQELRLPKNLLDKAARRDNEYGWRLIDVLDVIEAARKVPMGTIGGQVQYIPPSGTCELYWLSYDSSDRKKNEDWLTYCNRSANECSEKFKQLLHVDIQQDAINSFPNSLTENGKAIDNINDYQIFILYFDDEETDRFIKK
jgi:hypothetical protein